MTVKVVTGCSNLGFQTGDAIPDTISLDKLRRYLDEMTEAVGEENIWAWWDFPYEEVWAGRHFDLDSLKPDTPTPASRFLSDLDHLKSNTIMHQKLTWGVMASALHPDITTWLYFDCGVLKQGDWTGKRVTGGSIKRMFDKVSADEPTDIPYPGIEEMKPVIPGQPHWRFVGSTQIWPTRFLKQLETEYRYETCKWVKYNGTLPIDLPILALVEQNSELPFRWYQAEYDSTQMDNYPG